MKKDMRKRMMAGSMAVVTAAGLCGVYEWQNPGIEAVAKEETTEVLEEAAEEVLAGNDKSTEEETKTGSGSEVFKEESVYVKADSSGKADGATVTEWIKNPGNGSLKDSSGLKEIKNIKGEEEYTQGSGEELTWKSEGNDIYYQGTTNEKLPVGVNISYKLNGRAVKAEELEGKNGKVEIHIDYENHAKEEVEVNGETVEMYTPFTMVTAMMLPGEEYTNVTIDNGKIMSDADKNIVVGLGFPGLAQNLKLEDKDFDIPESVTITADVKNASVEPTITVASAEIMEDFSLDDVSDFDSLEDSIRELEDASEQLADGSKDAADGSKELADGSKELADGSKELADGTKELADGSKTVADGSKELADGSKELAGGSKELADGVNTLNEKSKDLTKGVNDLADGFGAYANGMSSLYEGSIAVSENTAKLREGADTLNAGMQQAAAGANELAGGAAAVKVGMGDVANQLGGVSAALSMITESNLLASVEVSSVTVHAEVSLSSDEIAAIVEEEFAGYDEDTKAAARQAVSAALAQAQNQVQAYVDTPSVTLNETGLRIVGAASQANSGVGMAQGVLTSESSPLVQGVDSIQAGAGRLAGMLGTGDGTTQTLGSGAAALADGTARLAEGAKTLEAGAKQLYENSKPLLDGAASLRAGGAQLAAGVGQLAAGANQVSDGANALADGSVRLADGSGQLEAGSSRLVAGSQQLADGSVRLMDGAAALADGNQQLADGMEEFKTSGIDKIADVYDNDIKAMTSRLDAMSDLGKKYRSFAGIKDGMNGSTKFIIETEGVE